MNVVVAVGGFLVDWNRSHLFNPAWPPHAKFHNGMTISMALMLGGLGSYALARGSGDSRDNLVLGAICPAIFLIAQATALAYPNTGTIDREFPDWPKLGRLPLNEMPFAVGMLALDVIGWILAAH